MDTSEIIRLMEAVKHNNISALEISEGNISVRIERTVTAVQGAHAAAALPIQADMAAPDDAPESSADPHKSVESPLVGIFHPVDEAKGVRIGATLKKGTTVCIVEAMKLMNEITMPEDGELIWLAAKDGDAVEFGQTLFHYR